MSDLHVVIMAAGRGTRMNDPELPKVMVPIFGRPMLGHVIDRSLELEPASVVVVIGYRGEVVANWIENEYSDSRVTTAIQAEQLGTAHAVEQAMPSLPTDGSDDNVLVLSGDVPGITTETLRNLVAHHESTAAVVTVLTVELDDPSGYGRVIRNEKGRLVRIVEQKDADQRERSVREINAGLYLFDRRTLADLLPRVESDNAQGEYYLPDVIEMALAEGGRVEAYQSAESREVRGVNTPEQLLEIEEGR